MTNLPFNTNPNIPNLQQPEEWGGLNRPSFFLRKDDCYGD